MQQLSGKDGVKISPNNQARGLASLSSRVGSTRRSTPSEYGLWYSTTFRWLEHISIACETDGYETDEMVLPSGQANELTIRGDHMQSMFCFHEANMMFLGA